MTDKNETPEELATQIYTILTDRNPGFAAPKDEYVSHMAQRIRDSVINERMQKG